MEDFKEQDAQQAQPQPTKKSKTTRSYACTPRQLEALKKAREAKRLRQQQQIPNPLPRAVDDEAVEDMRHVSFSDFKEPVQVVRDNKLLKQFLEAEKIDAQETGLGKRQRDEPQGLDGLGKRLRELNFDLDDPEVRESSAVGKAKILLGVGVGVGCGLGLAYWASQRNQQASSKPVVQQKEARAFAQPSTEARSESLQPATPPPKNPILRAPWEQ